MAPCVSVIIPAYNCGRYVRPALDSVRAQTFGDFEVILADDGSADDTLEQAQACAKDWPRLTVLHIEHAGLAAARNAAIRQAKGTYLALLDADDLWLPEKLQACMDFLAANPQLNVVYHPMAAVDEQARPLPGRAKACRGGKLTAELFESIFINDPTAVFHRRVIETCGGFDESLPVCVGHEFWLRVSRSFEIGLIDRPLALRRCGETSLTRGNRLRSRRVRAHMLERFYFEQGGRELLDEPKALRRLSRVFYGAGKACLRQGYLRQGREYLAKAIRYCPGFLKSYPLYALAAAGGVCWPKRTDKPLLLPTAAKSVV